jgi:NAD(P)-dependent dehydrogenase (short-subunit alcohol dehydrogenase family)
MSFSLGFISLRQFVSTPPVPTASFKSNTVVITGANSGLGLEAAHWVVKLDASQVILTCRNEVKGNEAVSYIKASTSCSVDILKVYLLNLSDLDSIMSFVDRVKELPRLDVVIADAGVNNHDNFKPVQCEKKNSKYSSST